MGRIETQDPVLEINLWKEKTENQIAYTHIPMTN